MGTVPVVEGEIESGEIDPAMLTHTDILELAKQYRNAVRVIDQQKHLMAEANRVIMKLQAALRVLKGEINEPTPNPAPAIPAQQGSPPPEEDANG